MRSVLSKVTKADVKLDPFPHIVVENALDDESYAALDRDFPGLDFWVDHEQYLANRKYVMMAAQCLDSPLISPAWKAFIEYHTSPAYFAEVLALFGDQIREYYPNIVSALQKDLNDLSVGIRQSEYLSPSMSHPYDVMLDCQPVTEYTFTERGIRGPHVDSANEIYAGLLYMRLPEDDSTGGSIALWRPKDEARTFPGGRTIRFESPTAVMDPEMLECVARVPYRPNTFVMFLNSWRSLHCAETRSATLFPRRAFNIIGEICRFPEPQLFTVDRPGGGKAKDKPSLLRRAASRLRRI